MVDQMIFVLYMRTKRGDFHWFVFLCIAPQAGAIGKLE